MPSVPTRNGLTLDRVNDALRQSPAWQNFMRRKGQPLDGRPIRLSERDRRELQMELSRVGFQIPSGMEVDPAGNFNQRNTGVFEKTPVRIGLIAGAALATAGAAGWGPLAGLLSSGGQAAGGTAASLPASGLTGTGTIASTTNPLVTSSILNGAAPMTGAMASQGVSASVGPLAGLYTGNVPSVDTLLGPRPTGGGSNGRDLPNTGAKGFGKQLLDSVLSPEGILGLAGLIPAITGMGQNSLQDDPNVKRQMDIANQSQQMQLDRYRRTDPLHESSVRLAYSMLPMSARNK